MALDKSNEGRLKNVDKLNDVIVAVCIMERDIEQFRSDFDSELDLYEKSKKFVSLFQEMKKTSRQPSNISIRKLNFQGKNIGLKDDTLNLLIDVLNGKKVKLESLPRTTNMIQETTQHSIQESSLLLNDATKENTLRSHSTHDIIPFRPPKSVVELFSASKHLLVNSLTYLKSHRKWTVRIAAILLILIVSLPAVRTLASKYSKEDLLHETIKRVSFSAELGTVEYKVKLVHIEKDENILKSFINNAFSSEIFGERSIAIVATAKLKAGIDMRNFSIDNVKVDGNSIIVTLPKAKMQNPEMGEIKCYEYSGRGRKSYNLNEVMGAQQTAEMDLRNYQKGCNILNDAEKNARTFFETLLRQLGYTSVNVNFN